MRVKDTIDNLLNVPTTDPDDARRRKLLNILLLGSGILTFLSTLATIAFLASGMEEEVGGMLWANLVILLGIAIIYAANRYWSGGVASWTFLLIVTIPILFTEEPQEITSGRSLFLLVIPILMASVLSHSWTSFIMAGLVGSSVSAIEAFVLRIPVTVPVTLGFFAVALVSWLAARSLEQALKDLRILNEELEQRVVERTRELAEALGKNEAILESIADGVIVFDNNGKATMINPALSTLTGRKVDEVMGCGIESLMDDDISAGAREAIIALLRGREQKRDSSLRVEWGERQTLSVNSAPVRTGSGDVIGTVAVFRDFTKEAEVDRMKSALVSMVSHDLRTPLSAIMGYAEMLQEMVYGPLTDKQYSTMDRITANAKRLLSLVNDLLDQAQIEAGKLALKTTDFAPTELVEGVQSVMGVLAQTKGLELTNYVEDDVPVTLQGDPQRLHQILVNLVGNALKFTEQGGVHVRVYSSDEAHWAMAVSDTGPGIPADKLGRVFERFYQVDGVTTRKHQGVGLGLSIVRQLVVLMGGRVGVESEVGKGSTFSVLLPLVPPQIEEESS